MPWEGLPPHRIAPHECFCGRRKRRYAVEGTAPPPHCFLVWCFVVMTCFRHVGGIFWGKSWREPNPATHHDKVLRLTTQGVYALWLSLELVRLLSRC